MPKIEWVKNGAGEKIYPPTIPQAIKDPDTKESLDKTLKEKMGVLEEKAVAQALSELNAKVNALEEIVSKKVLERLEIANEFNLHGKTNMILSGEGAPTMTPDFVGQRYLDTTGKIAYSAFGVNNAGDWK